MYYFTFSNMYAEAILRIGLQSYNTGFKLGGRTINNLRYAKILF